MLTLFRGGPVVVALATWTRGRSRSPTTTGSRSSTATASSPARAVVSHRIPSGVGLMYHSQDRHVNVPRSELVRDPRGTDNSVTRISIKPTHLIGGYAQLSYGFNYYGPTAPQRDELVAVRKLQREVVRTDAGVRAQIAMVMNLDKCIGCHTCSVTCKNVWTNRRGAEYIWFNDVETKPGVGYPKRWEDQEQLEAAAGSSQGGQAAAQGRRPAAQARDALLQPRAADARRLLRALDLRLRDAHDAPGRRSTSRSRGRSRRSPGRPLDLQWGPNWEDDLAGAPERAPARPEPPRRRRGARAARVRESVHVLPPAHLRALPQPVVRRVVPLGAMYKRAEDGIVLVDQEQCRSWRMCVSGCPYKKVYFNWSTGKAEKCTLCYPRIEAGPADDLLRDVRRARSATSASSSTTPTGSQEAASVA